jgi:hypothetical protein
MPSAEVAATTKTIHAHRALAEAGVQQYYACEGLPSPLTLWLCSPVAGAMVADLLASVHSHGPLTASSCLWDIVGRPFNVGSSLVNELLLNEVRSQIWGRSWGMTAKEVGHQFHVSTERNWDPQASFPFLLYAVWPNTVGYSNAHRIWKEFKAAPAIALSDSEKRFLSRESYLEGTIREPYVYQYAYGEAGRAITTYLDAYGSATTDFTRPPHTAFGPIESPERAKSLYQIARHCGWLWMFEGVCVLTDPPEVLRVDDAGRLHCENGPAWRYSDGLELYAWHGVQVPPLVIKAPASITLHMIKDTHNSEVRRVMIERRGGLARYAMDGGFTLVDELPADHSQIGLRTAKLWQGDEDDDIDEHFDPLPSMHLDLLNSTPEPDGTTKRYMLRVDPSAYGGEAARCVQAAAASTWRNADGTLTYPDWRDYAPVAES